MRAPSDRPAAGPGALLVRAVFVPDGAQPPAEFMGHFSPLRFRATLDRTTGAITCGNAGINFGGDVAARWYPDEEQSSGDDEAVTSDQGFARRALDDQVPSRRRCQGPRRMGNSVGLRTALRRVPESWTATVSRRRRRRERWPTAPWKPDEPYGLDPETARFITTGFTLGKSGLFDRPATRSRYLTWRP